MKNFFLCLMVLLFFSFRVQAQEVKIVSGLISSGMYQTEIPEEVQSKLTYENQKQEFIRHTRYCDNLKGEISIVTDSKDRIVAVTVPYGTSVERLRDIAKCFKRAFWGEGTGWGGFWDCLFAD